MSVNRTKTPGGSLELRPQTGQDDTFQAPTRAGTAASDRSRALRTPRVDLLKSQEGRLQTEKNKLPKSRPEDQSHVPKAQVLQFADIGEEAHTLNCVSSVTAEAPDKEHEVRYPLDTPFTGNHDRTENPIEVSLSSTVLFDTLRQAKKREKLEKLEAQKLEEQAKEQEREKRLKDLAIKRQQEYWDRRNKEDEESRKEREASELRRKKQREEQERLAAEKENERAFFQKLLSKARQSVHEQNTAENNETLQQPTQDQENSIVRATVILEGLSLQTAGERSKLPKIFKGVIASKMSLDSSRVRVTKITEKLPSTFEIGFEVKPGNPDPHMVDYIRSYTANGGLQSDLAARGLTSGSVRTEEAFAFASMHRTKSTSSWRPEENDSDPDNVRPASSAKDESEQDDHSASVHTKECIPEKSFVSEREATTNMRALDFPRAAAQHTRLIQAPKAKASPRRTSHHEQQETQNLRMQAKATTKSSPSQAHTESTSPKAAPSAKEKPSAEIESHHVVLPKIVPSLSGSPSIDKGGRRLLHLASFKELLQNSFKSVFDAFVFFDSMKVNFVSTKNLMRGLVKLEANHLVGSFPALVRDFEWKCVDHGKVYCGEFVQLLSWHHVEDFNKEMSAARLAFDRQTRAEHNKAISIKVAKPQKSTPVCEKLREILKSKYKTVAAFMVVANMDVTHVLSFRDLQLAFRKEGIEGIDVEELAVELSDPSFPPTAIKTQSFSKTIRWHSLEEVEAALKEERLGMFRERNKLEKGLPQIPLPPNSVPFFRERPEVEKAVASMKRHFENAADAFCFFDTDDSGEITRVKMAHGLQRLQNLDGNKVTLDFEKLMPELQNLQFTGGVIDAAGFIWNFRWHEKPPDISEAVWVARRKKFEKAAIIPAQKSGGKTGVRCSDRKLLYSVTKSQSKRNLQGLLGNTVSMDEWLRGKELGSVLTKLATVRIESEPINERNSVGHASAVSARGDQTGKESSYTVVDLQGEVESKIEHPSLEDTAETCSKRFAKAQTDADGRTRPSRLAVGAHEGGVGNIYAQQLNRGRQKRLRHQGNSIKAKPPPPREIMQTPLVVLKMALQDRGFQNSIDAYAFFDGDQKGSLTRGDLQKGLLALRIFKVTARMIPFPKVGNDGIDRMDLLQFLVLCAWDDSLNEILAMQRPEIEQRLNDSYHRRADISSVALDAAAKSTDKSNAELKAQVLKGLTDLPNLFHSDSNGQRPRGGRGSQTDRSHAHASNGSKHSGRRKHGSETERAGKLPEHRVQAEMKMETEDILGVPNTEEAFISNAPSQPDDPAGGQPVQQPRKIHRTDQNVPAIVPDIVSEPVQNLRSLKHQNARSENTEPGLDNEEHGHAEQSHAHVQLQGQGDDLLALPKSKQPAHSQRKDPVNQLDDPEDSTESTATSGVLVQVAVEDLERTKNYHDNDDDWDILDDDPRNQVPKDPRAALLAEKFVSDRIMRIENKNYIYEGQVNEEGKPHGHGIKLYLTCKPSAPSKDDQMSEIARNTSKNQFRRPRKTLAPPPTEDEQMSLHENWQVGRFSRGKMTGSGMMRTPDGSYYFGDFKEGKRHGAGMSISPSGIVYEGEFFDDMRDGCGCVWATTGPAYFGEWHLDRRHGSGVTGTSNPSFLEKMKQTDKPLLPNSSVETAIQFEAFVVITKNHVRGSTNKMISSDHELMVEAILWNSTQSRTTACEGWNVGMSSISRLTEYIKVLGPGSGTDATIAAVVSRFQLAQRFDTHGKELVNIPKIPLWVMIQPSYACISAESPLPSPAAASPSSSPRGVEAGANSRSPGKTKVSGVRFIKN